MRLDWLGGCLSDAGLDVVEWGQPRGRGRGMAAVHGVVLHDAVTTRAWSDARVANLLRDGYTGLPGPLAQLGLDRQGLLYWVADGRSNHNGLGQWGNDAIGIEVFCAGGLAGREEPWNSAQTDVAARASAAILAHVGLPAGHARGHRETDPVRKIDPYRVDLHAVRAYVAELMGAPPAPPIPAPEEDTMAGAIAMRWTDSNEVRVGQPGGTWFSPRNWPELQALAARSYVARTADGEPDVWVVAHESSLEHYFPAARRG